MNETPRKMTMTSSSSGLAIVAADKRPPQRPGGCVGIFFQLFDWNRRLTKKKLFSQKLLPPVRAAKRISKKFAGNEKMPKFLLIDKENSGGFPNTKKLEIEPGNIDGGNTNHCAPSLVARLMGLESMPAVEQEKPRKAFDSQGCCDYSETPGSTRHRQDLNLERSGHCKLESRPQKLQRTVSFERHPDAGHLGLEELQFNKIVPTHLRKQHHKLVSPVKNQRLLSKRSSARLMEAATKILEPGLQSRNRTKCALTYTVRSAAHMQESNTSSLKNSEESTSNSYVSPCKNCGSLVGVADLNLKLEEPQIIEYASSASDCSSVSLSGDEFRESKLKQAVSVTKESRTPPLSFQAKANMQSRAGYSVERKPQIQNNQDQCKPHQNVAPRCGLKHNSTRQNEMPLVRDNVNTGRKFYSKQQSRTSVSNGSTDFSRNSNNTRARMAPISLDSRKTETEKYGLDKKTLDRKRRSINNSQIEKASVVNSTLAKERDLRSSGIGRRRSIKQSCAKVELRTRTEGDHASGSKDMGIVSFAFSAPMRHDSRSFSSVGAIKMRKGQPELMHDDAPLSENLTRDVEIRSSLSSQRETPLGGDALNILLQEKIRELTGLDRDEVAMGDDAYEGRSTAAILEELISALTMGKPRLQKEVDDFSFSVSHTDSSCCSSTDSTNYTNSSDKRVDANNTYQAEAVATMVSAGFLRTNDFNQSSPVSILEASFSNDSCLSESLNGSSEHKAQYGLMKSSYSKSQSCDPETDISDSATSINLNRVESESVNIFTVHDSDPNEVILPECKPNYIREVISSVELLFQNISSHNCDQTVDSSIYPLLLDVLEALVNALWMSPKCYFNSMEAKQENQFRRLLFDCIIEHLDSTYSRYYKSGYRVWAKLPVFLNRDKLTGEVYDEIRRWGDGAGKILDAIVEKEMSHWTGKWLNFEIEAFEAGMEIQTDILQALVDEMVIDLL